MNSVFKIIHASFEAAKVRRAARIVAVTAFLLTAIWRAEVAAQSVLRGPYLQLGTPSSLIIRWRTDNPTDSNVDYGTVQGNLTLAASDPVLTTEHEVPLTGLAPDTVYYYSVGTTTQPLAGNDSEHFFLTSPPTGSVKPTRIWVLGDSGTANANARAVRDAYFAFTGPIHTDLWLMLGDNAYSDGTDSQYQAAVFDIYPTMLRKSVLWSTLGNHDGISADSATQSGPYYDIFSLPRNAEAGGLDSGTEAYYSFDYANVHFVCLDSQETDRSSGGAMLTWLGWDLADTVQDWIIAFWHHPPYSKGSHNSDTESELIEMRENAVPILEFYGVDLVLSGHSHSYERSFLLDGHYGTSGTLTSEMILNSGDGRDVLVGGDGTYDKFTLGPAPHEGAVYCVAGSSGKISGGSLDHPAMFISVSVLGSVVLDIDDDQLDLLFIDSSGAIADSCTIIKGSGIPPAAPSNLTVAAFSDSQIDLAWKDNSTNESGFKIERFFEGSWPEIATVGPGVVSYSDTGLAPETTYFYRVRATTAFGDSAYSLAASDTTFEQGTVTSLADGEIPVSGTTSGTFVDTHASDDVYESITERQSGGRPSRRHSFLEHKWTFTVPAGDVATLFVEAHHTNNAESDDFDFAYSTDDSTYTNLLTVIKTSDDDAAQIAFLPSSVSGTVYVRVRDTDQSQGNNALDTVLVDRIYIRTASGDTVAPAAPVNLIAVASSPNEIDLDWADNSESDLASYNLYRSTNPGPPYTLIGSGITASNDLDPGLSPSTTYYYAVKAVDTSQNVSGFSIEASATTLDFCTPSTLHVDSIVLAVENLGKGNKRGRVEVTIVDECGNPLSGANVTGTFTGDFNETVNENTDESGVAVLVTTGAKKGSTAFTFCVDSVKHGSLDYAGEADVETCDSNS